MGNAGQEALTSSQSTLSTRTGKTLKLDVWAPAFTGFGGGIGSFSRALAAGVNDLGHDAHLFGKLYASGSWNGMQLSGCGNSAIAQKQRFAALCLASCGFRKPDSVISTHVNFGPVAHLAKKLMGTQFTLVAHGIDVHTSLPRTTIAALRAADRVVAVSSWTRERVLALGGIEPERVKVLANTLDENRFTLGAKPRALVDRYSILPGERVVLTVARLKAEESYKGYDRLVEALPFIQAACGKVRLVIAGDGDDTARVRAMARQVGVEDAVTLTGFLTDAELPDHYRLADVFAMPSTGEGFGIVYIEAMGCGTPVLAGDCDGSADAVAGGELGLMVDPRNVRAVADGVIALLKGEGPRRWFDRATVREAVISRFGHAAFREHLREVLLPPRGGHR